MTTGIIALAVPGSTAFAGEFAILAGVFRTGWIWAVLGAVAIVLAAMYMLRLISAVLHRAQGPAVSDAALDLRPAELGVIVPLVACLLVLSAWPAAISGHSFARDSAQAAVSSQFRTASGSTSSARPTYSITQTVTGVGTGGITGVGLTPSPTLACHPPECGVMTFTGPRSAVKGVMTP